jgi:hypothetical protein
VTIVIEDDTATVTDGTDRSAFICICGVGEFKWGLTCTGDAGCKLVVVGYARRTQAIRAGEWHLKWHRNGKPRCQDCGRDLGRRGATRCRPGTCMEES